MTFQGHIALDEAVFPENTPGFVLDAFARSSLWKIGLDYRHGTCPANLLLDLICEGKFYEGIHF